MNIQDAIKVSEKNEICLGFASVINNAFKAGYLAFI